MEDRNLNRVSVLLAACLLLYGSFLAIFSTGGFPAGMQSGRFLPFLSDKPVGEDGFYMLTVAWNLASGQGITYNDNQPTTGIQPLYTLVEAGAAWMVQQVGGDKWDLTRSIILLGTINLVVFAHLAGMIARTITPGDQALKQISYMIAFLITTFNYGLFRIFTYGLETGLYLILVAIIVYTSLQLDRADLSWRNSIGFGLLCGLATLARIDFLLLMGGYLLVGIIRKHVSYLWALSAGVTAMMIASPWFMYVYHQSGSLMPSSGFAQSGIVDLSQYGMRAWEMLRAIISHLAPWIYSRPSVFLSLLAILILSGLLIYILRSVVARQYIGKVLHSRLPYTSWMIAIAILIPVYLITFQAVHFYTRYISPIVVATIPFLAALLAFAIKNQSAKKQLALALLLPLSFFLWALITMHTGAITNNQSVVAGYAQQQFPPSVKIGAFQSGILGYFNPNVINLDGKVNADALLAQQEGTMNQYLDNAGISVLLDWPEIIANKLPEKYLKENWEPCPQAIPDDRSICLFRKFTP